MTITNIDKKDGHIYIVKDGVPLYLTVVGKDMVVSVPPIGKHLVVNLYVDEATSKLYVAYHQDGWEVGSPTILELAGGVIGDMLKSVYDTDEDGVVDDAEKLEGSTKSEVQDHTPKAHTLGSHSTKAHSELTGVGSGDHHTKYTDAEAIKWAIVFGS